MGCDIHLFVEHKRKNSKDWNNIGSEFRLPRNYFIFGILSEGVRSNTTFNFPPRGVPEDVGYKVNEHYRVYVTDTENYDEPHVKTERAIELEKRGYKVWRDVKGEIAWVQDTDWHSHSWLTRDEYKQALDFFNEKADYREIEYEAVHALMLFLEDQDFDVRCVFWFDN